MQREAVDVPTPLMILICLHDGFGPHGEPRLAAARADGDLEHPLLVPLRRIEVPDEPAVNLKLAQIVVGRHVAAAVPAFVADAEVSDLVGSGMTIGGAFLGQSCGLRRGKVLQPLGCFLRGTGADVDREIRLGADLVEEVHELVRPERVRLDHSAPVGIERLWPLRADAFAPVVFVREAAARPANVRRLYRLQCGDDVVADAPRIRNWGIRTDPYALINAMAEVLGE